MKKVEESELRTILKKVIDTIKPEKEIFFEVNEIIERINKLLKQSNIDAECMAGGSYAKGTILKNDFDIDLFVRFDYSYKDKDISKLLGKAIQSLGPELVHGSRDYYQLRVKGLCFEIIPVLKIEDYKQAVNVTDMSPLHVVYVRKKFADKPWLPDEIRLAKQFCKAIGVYGAESYIRGFSGHVLDLLIIYYGGFEQLLMQASVWGKRVIIDLEKHLRDPLSQLNKAKTESPLVMVDPVQPFRNAAASLSKEKFELFKQKAREFLENPTINFFIVKKIDVAKLKRKAGNDALLVLKVKPLQGNKDVVGTKVLKVFEHLGKHLRKNDFKVIDASWEFDMNESLLYYIVKNEKLSPSIIFQGPPLREKKDAKRFMDKHVKVFEKNGRLYAEEKRIYMTPKELLKDLIMKAYVKERVENIALL